MSTRASVIVKDDRDVFYFYQHSDGYPQGLGETISAFLDTRFAENSKDDIEYLAGALISFVNWQDIKRNWSCVSLVPAKGVHGDEEWQYVIDAVTLELSTIHRSNGFVYK